MRDDLPWVRAGEEWPECEVGDQFLIQVPLSRGGYEYSVIVMSETGWDTPDGDSWSAWDWSCVVRYVCLNRRLPSDPH